MLASSCKRGIGWSLRSYTPLFVCHAYHCRHSARAAKIIIFACNHAETFSGLQSCNESCKKTICGITAAEIYS